MELFNAVVFGAFVGFLTDYWLGQVGIQDNTRLITAVVVAVVVAVLVVVGELMVF